MDLPKDPVILLGVMNTKLRNFYPTLEELCKSLCVERRTIEEPLAAIGYEYDPKYNQFRW